MSATYLEHESLASDIGDWRDRICSTFVDLDCEDVDREQFFGGVSSRQCDDLRFSRVYSTRQRVVRSAARLARSTADDFLLSLQTQGTGRVRQGGREAFQNPGDMALYDTSRPYELSFDGNFRQLILKLPRAQVLRAIPGAEDLTAVAIVGTNAAARLATSYLNAFAKQCVEIGSGARRVANATVFDLLAMSFSSAELLQSSRKASDALFNRAIVQIDDHLSDPDLNPASIAVALGVSLRYLNLVFAKHDLSVSRTIWHRRIQRSARDLQNPALASASITSIAFSLGFNDTAHFTRAFKIVYDETPSAFRSRLKLAR
jgi:AraC-like DNA-binding protein